MGPGYRKAVQMPLILVPGWSDGPRALDPLRSRFLQAGWPETALTTVRFADRVGSNREHARELAQTVTDLRRATGAKRVGLIAHSMGGLAARMMMGSDGAGDVVAGAAFLGTPHHGTWVAYLGWGKGAREMRPGSEFVRELADLEGRDGIPALDLWTPLETHVIPRKSARRAGVPQARVPRALHWWMPRSPIAFQHLETFFLEIAS